MVSFDEVLADFQSKISHNTIIRMDYLVTAILDIAVKIVREYNEPRYESTVQIAVGAFSIAFKVISSPNTIDRNIMFIDLVNSRKPWDDSRWNREVVS